MNKTTSLWNIHNTTRYSTEDIEALFAGFEAWATAMGSKVEADRGHAEGTVRIVDYTPMRSTYSRVVITPGGPIKETLRVYIRGPSPFVRHLRDVGLVKPSQLYDNPVEALSAPRVNGAEAVPVGFVQQFVTDAVAHCYKLEPHLRPETDGFPFEAYPIRITARRASAKQPRSKRPEQLRALEQEQNELRWRLRCLEQAILNVKESAGKVERHHGNLKLPQALNADFVGQLFDAAYRQADVALSSDIKQVWEELQG